MLGVFASRQGDRPNPLEYQFEWMDRVAAEGGRVLGQATTRSINAIFSLKSYLPFDALPAWAAIRGLPGAEQKVALPRCGHPRRPRRGGSGDAAAGAPSSRAAAPPPRTR